jgi:TolB protein
MFGQRPAGSPAAVRTTSPTTIRAGAVPCAVAAAVLAGLLTAAGCGDDPEAPPPVAPVSDLVFEGVLGAIPELLRLDCETGAIARLLPEGTFAQDPQPSPDGTKLAFVVADHFEGTGDIFLCDRDGGNVRQLTTDPELDDQPCWSPDGARIAFRSFRTLRDGDIWVMDADGGNATNLTPDQLPGITDERTPCWSPDGTRIAYISNTGGNRDLWTMAADGSDPQRLVATPDLEAEPAWSPDGTWIAYRRSSDAEGSDLWLIPAAGGTPAPLVLAGEQRLPAWAPDGSRLVFVSQATPADRPDLWEVRPDGTGLRALVSDQVAGGSVNPAFRPPLAAS